MGRTTSNSRRNREVPSGFIKCTLRKDEYLLVTLRVFGTMQSNYRTGGRAILFNRFKLDCRISDKREKGFRELSHVLPKMIEMVSLNSDLCTKLSNHLWHVGIDVDPIKIQQNYDLTGRKTGGYVERTYQWYVKGPLSNE